jgi:peptide/nickel transport system substrate-binding protein
MGLDDPDAVFYEHFSCDSQRNYNDYCNREVERLFDVQSAEPDRVKRRSLVQQIDVRLMEEATKLILSYRMNYHPHSAYVKNWIPHPVSANGWRLTHVWLDK